jgi:hypothetical protein
LPRPPSAIEAETRRKRKRTDYDETLVPNFDDADEDFDPKPKKRINSQKKPNHLKSSDGSCDPLSYPTDESCEEVDPSGFPTGLNLTAAGIISEFSKFLSSRGSNNRPGNTN